MEQKQELTTQAAARLHNLFVLRRIVIQKATQGSDLHFGQLRVVEYIAAHEGCTQAEVAECMMVTPASMALTTKRLEKAGLLNKVVDEHNLRCKRLSVTERGRNLATQSRGLHDQFDERLFEGFSAEQMAQINTYLSRMICNITGEDTLQQEGGSIDIKQLGERFYAKKEENQ